MSFVIPQPAAGVSAIVLGLGLLLTAACGQQQSAPAPPQATGETDQQAEHDLTHLMHPPTDPRVALRAALTSGGLVHDGDDNQFLRGVLKTCGVPVASQVLVFSKTSMQSRLITPSNPRAIYFSDDVYIGFVPGGVLEFSDTDPEEGTAFYSLDPRGFDLASPFESPVNCLNCHEGSRTHYAPGLMIRSVYPDEAGHPIGSAGSFTTGHESPLEERWGGWYVTGQHGSARHMGNAIAVQHGNDAVLDTHAGANLATLDGMIDTDRYLAPGSDIVALMVLEHQVEMHNLLTQGSVSVRRQAWRSRRIVESTGEAFDPYASDTLMSLVTHAAERIVKHILFVDEVALSEPIQGDRAFLRGFRANRRDDAAGRSLKDIDLDTRLFKFRCSYMLYSRAFDLMHDLLKEAVYRELYDALSGPETEANQHLGAEERAAILVIVRETKDGLPGYWSD